MAKLIGFCLLTVYVALLIYSFVNVILAVIDSKKEDKALKHTHEIFELVIPEMPDEAGWMPDDVFIKKCVEKCRSNGIETNEEELWKELGFVKDKDGNRTYLCTRCVHWHLCNANVCNNCLSGDHFKATINTEKGTD